MKLIVRLFLFAAFTAVVLYAVLFIFINARGRNFAIESFRNNFKVTPSIGRLTMDFPFDLHVYNFELDNVYFAELHIIPNLFKMMRTGRIALGDVDISGLKVKLTIDDKGLDAGILGKKLVLAPAVLPQFSLIPSAFAASDVPSRCSIDNFHVEDGVIEVADKSKKRNEIYFLRDFSLDLRDFVYPELTKFYIKASVSLESGKTFIRNIGGLDGWIDYASKDMDVEWKFNNIDYCLLAKYLPPNWQPSKLGLKEGILDFDINAKSQYDNMVITCAITVPKYTFIEEANAQDLSRMKTAKTILAVLTGPNGKPAYTFSFPTKMDSPQFDLKPLRDGLSGTVNMPWLLVDGVISGAVNALSKGGSGATELTGDTVNAAADFLTDIYKQVKGSHKKKHKGEHPVAEVLSSNAASAPVVSANNSSTSVTVGITIPSIESANAASGNQALSSNVSVSSSVSASVISR